MYDYHRSLPSEAVRVRFCAESDEARRASLEPRLRGMAARYGFRFALSSRDEIDADRSRATLEHVIVLAGSPYDPDLVTWSIAALERVDTVSLGFTYADVAEMLSFRAAIEQIKTESSGRVNFLRPDEVVAGRWRVSDQKIADNAVCDSVRIKYRPVKRAASAEARLSARERRFFDACSKLYSDFHLYHRSPTDGYFAIRSGGAFAITATKTDKIQFDFRRVSFVHAYDRAKNELHYSGAFLPSSDAVEAAALFAMYPDINAVYHSHASELFTRNPAFSGRRLVPALPYGDPTLGDALVDALSRVNDGFIIMEEHGEIFAARREDAFTMLNRIENLCARAVGRAGSDEDGYAYPR